jgi:two-component system, OmpR family, phosphate regulon sensor histidine kinase PhoR
MSFRKKILLAALILFFIFLGLLFPFVEMIVNTVTKKNSQEEIRELTLNFEVGFLGFGIFILMLYTLSFWLIIHRITRPIQQIIDLISPYQEGKEEFLPPIHIGSLPSNEFKKLANTLNVLSERTKKQIASLKQQKKESEGILESLGEGIIALNSVGKITFVNEVTCNLLSTEHEEIIGRSLDEIVSHYPDLLFRCSELALQVLQTSESIVETWGRGSNLYLHLVAAPLAGQNGAIIVLQDKTSDYKILEMGKDFIANASHELRTPITVIRGFAEMLHDLPKVSPAMLQEISAKILRTSLRLEKLVQSLLTLSDLENLSREQFQAVDLLPMVEQCKALQLAVNPEALISIHCDLPKAIAQVDADVFEMAIMNLLDNAIKYSAPPAEIMIRMVSQGARFLFEIEDKGIGIPESELPHIFDRFYTVDKARSRQTGGAGLGLSIVRTIVEKHRGEIAVFSQVGQGTHFKITIP